MTEETGDRWQRARQPEQKEARRAEILEAAGRLYEAVGLDGMSLNGVAREVGQAKSNLYRYFESLEEILLHLFLRDFDQLLAELTKATSAGASAPEASAGAAALSESHAAYRGDVGRLAELIAERVEAHPRFAALLAQLSGVMERPLSYGVADRFKREIQARAELMAGWMQLWLPGLGEQQAAEAMLAMHAMIAGFWPMAHPSPVMEGVLAQPDLQQLRVCFRPAFAAALTAYLLGLPAAEKEPS